MLQTIHFPAQQSCQVYVSDALVPLVHQDTAYLSQAFLIDSRSVF